jgi:hypothetical protein
MLQLLTQVDDVKATEAALQSEKARHLEQIAQSEADLRRTESDIANCRENEARLKKELTDLRDEIFARPEDAEEIIQIDEVHVPTDGSAGQKDNTAKRAWDERAKHLKQVQ